MIVTNLDSAIATLMGQNYALRKALSFLRTQPLSNLKVGRYNIDTNIDIFANIQEYVTKSEANGRWESHRRYIDCQFIVSGSECIRVLPATTLTVKTDAILIKDAYYYAKPAVQAASTLILTPGDCVLLFPQDAHEACLKTTTISQVKKVVVKIPVSAVLK
ncbi:NanQ anomerase/TabA/YiaL family protein [Lacticaseibacillus sp. GG6-2]